MRTGSTVPGALRHAPSSPLTRASCAVRCRQSTRTVSPVGEPCSSIPTAAVSGRAVPCASTISILASALVVMATVSLVIVS